MTYDMTSLFALLATTVHAHPGITLSAAVAMLEVERHTVERACRLNGTTFRTLRQEARFELACKLLTSTDQLSIKQVAASVGYSPRAFVRFIRMQSGCAPHSLRAALRSSRE